MDNSKGKNNALTEVARAVIKHDFTNVKSIKSNGTIFKPDSKGQINFDNNSNNSNPPINSTIPDSGMNMDPGLNLSDVEQLWTGQTSATTATNITLNKEFSDIGDGIQLALQIVKTPITNGQSGTVSILPAVASTDAKPQAGKYVCSVPIPISILAKNLVVGKTIDIVLDGIGEALSTTKISQSPIISIYVKDNKTLTITNHQGYALDKMNSDNNGAFYDSQIISINSFTKAKPVPQLPNGTVLFNGSLSNGEMKLNGVLDSFANVGDGLLIYFEPKYCLKYFDPSAKINGYLEIEDLLQITNPLRLMKKDLHIGSQINLLIKVSNGEDMPVHWSSGSTNLINQCSIMNLKGSAHFTVNSNSLILSNDITLELSRPGEAFTSTDKSLTITKIVSLTN